MRHVSFDGLNLVRLDTKRWRVDAQVSHDLLERDTTVTGEFTEQQRTFCLEVFDHVG
jgi:hypothetical protein